MMALFKQNKPMQGPQGYLRVCYTCNSRCRFCCTARGWDKPTRPYEHLLRELDRMRGSNPSMFALSVSGGEPLLHPRVEDILAYARDLGFTRIHMNTNARLIKDADHVRRLMDAGLTSAMVSMHGKDAAMQDFLTRRQGSFDQMRQGVDAMAEAGLRFRFMTVICRDNVSQLKDILRLAVKEYPQAESMTFCYPMLKDITHYDKDLVALSFREVAPLVREIMAEGDGEGMHVIGQLFPPCLLGRYYRRAAEFRRPDYILSDTDLMRLKPAIDEDTLLWPLCVDCEARQSCTRIQYEYVLRYGYEEELYSPLTGITGGTANAGAGQ